MKFQAGPMGEISDATLRVPLLESLYHDEIPPTASNLRCRWQEIVTEYEKTLGKSLFTKKITVQSLLRMYAAQPTTLVIVDQHVEGAASDLDSKRTGLLKKLAAAPGKAVAPEIARREAAGHLKLRTEPEVFLAGFRIAPKWFHGFVDPLGPDVYPEEMWRQLAIYLHSMISENEESCWFQGGRYGAAKDLRRRQLPFLEGRSLGELSHIVQLALTNEQAGGRGLLSYQPDKTIAPRSLSHKHLLADLGLPVGEGPQRRVGQGYATDEERWAELRLVLARVLSEHPEGRSLALLKVDIERRFGMILDQSVFREVKLSHVFESPEMRTLFEVRRAAQSGSASQVVVRLKDSAPTVTAPKARQTSQGPVSVPPPVLPAVTVPPPTHRVPMPNSLNSAPYDVGQAREAARPVAGNFGAHQDGPLRWDSRGQDTVNARGLQHQAPLSDPRFAPAKVGLTHTLRGAIERPPGLSPPTEGEATHGCPTGFELAQGFSNYQMEDFIGYQSALPENKQPAMLQDFERDAGTDFFGPGLDFAEDLLEDDGLFKDLNIELNTYSAAQAPIKPFFDTEALIKERQWSSKSIWGNHALPLGVPCA